MEVLGVSRCARILLIQVLNDQGSAAIHGRQLCIPGQSSLIDVVIVQAAENGVVFRQPEPVALLEDAELIFIQAIQQAIRTVLIDHPRDLVVFQSLEATVKRHVVHKALAGLQQVQVCPTLSVTAQPDTCSSVGVDVQLILCFLKHWER
uniref:Uncharacterized protein n=1 Tax=uncultured marine virus TaxID=186617 RepID=A0A0F7L210_9VIRU|nr:hypothetical protein [uncultured marine virus]